MPEKLAPNGRHISIVTIVSPLVVIVCCSILPVKYCILLKGASIRLSMVPSLSSVIRLLLTFRQVLTTNLYMQPPMII
jgi:hypothetical protein